MCTHPCRRPREAQECTWTLVWVEERLGREGLPWGEALVGLQRGCHGGGHSVEEDFGEHRQRQSRVGLVLVGGERRGDHGRESLGLANLGSIGVGFQRSVCVYLLLICSRPGSIRTKGKGGKQRYRTRSIPSRGGYRGATRTYIAKARHVCQLFLEESSRRTVKILEFFKGSLDIKPSKRVGEGIEIGVAANAREFLGLAVDELHVAEGFEVEGILGMPGAWARRCRCGVHGVVLYRFVECRVMLKEVLGLGLMSSVCTDLLWSASH